MKYRYFRSASQFRDWLSNNHASVLEIYVGFYKTGSGRKWITYAEALDEALCFGWIDGVRKNIDGERWSIRFTPRKSTSVWSLVNINHARRLTKLGKMMPAGLAAFQRRDKEKSKIYSYENQNRPLAAVHAKRFKSNKKAWDFFRGQAPSYQKIARWWIIRAKREDTRLRRLDLLIEASADGVRLDRFLSNK